MGVAHARPEKRASCQATHRLPSDAAAIGRQVRRRRGSGLHHLPGCAHPPTAERHIVGVLQVKAVIG